MTQLVASLRKELLLQWRTRAHIMAAFIFGAITLLLLSFAVGPAAEALRRHAAGFLWLALLFSSTSALAESFQTETEDQALEGLLLLPVGAAAVFYAKALINWLQLALLGLALVPVMVILYDASAARLGALVGAIFLGAAALAAPGTLYAGMTARCRSQQVLLPLLLFPLVVPVLLASVKATGLALEGDPMGQLSSWLILLVACNAVYWSLFGLFFERVVDDL
jgi:heme exporter protein B